MCSSSGWRRGTRKMVLYEVAGDGDVVIKASEEVTEFEKVRAG